MSKIIDERVVEMRFENGQFESNVKQSMSTIDRLKQALNFKDSSVGLDKTGKAATSTSKEMGTLGKSVETVRAKFSALDVMAVTALANITNSAVNAGKNIVKALTIDPVLSGFQEYELKMNSVQTIMANVQSKGKTMADVTKVLDELNHYADLTIYNFQEMTRNIGTFTAAGVDLDVAVSAIEGISNLAATSGSTSQQASTAMYQLSQAIAAGTVHLQDWNSVVNAGMGGETFQNALKQTAREMGVSIDSIIEKSGSFRESLSKDWLSADILNTTLKKFTVEGAKEYAAAMEASGKYTQEQSRALIEQAQVMQDAATKIKTFSQLWDVLKESAQSGWATTWEIIIGDFEEARESVSKLGDILTGVIEGFSTSRNELLSAALGGGGTSAWNELSAQVEKAGIDIEEFKTKLIAVGKEHGVVTDEMISNAGSFEASLREGWLDTSIFKEVMSSYTEAGKAVSVSTEDMTDKLAKFQKVVDEVWAGKWSTAPERYQMLADAGYDYAKVQELVNKTVDGHRLTIDELGESEMRAIGYTEDQIAIMRDLSAQADQTGSSVADLISKMSKPSGRELLWDSLFNVVTAVGKALTSVKDAYREVFPKMTSDQIYNVVESFNQLTEKLILSDEQASNLKSTFKGMFSVIRMLSTLIKSGVVVAFKSISSVLSNVRFDLLKYTGSIGETLSSMNGLVDSGELVNRVMTGVRESFQSVIRIISELIERFLSLKSVQNGIKSVADKVANEFDKLKELFGNTGETFDEFTDKLKSIDFSDGFKLDSLLGVLDAFKESVIDKVFDIQDVFDTLVFNIKAVPSDIQTGATKLGNGLSTLMDKLSQFVTALQEHIRPNINVGEILAIGLGGSSIYFIKQLGGLLEKLKGPMDAIEGAISNFGKIGSSISGYFVELTKAIKVNSIQGIAKAIVMLAGAMVAIAAIPRDKLLSSAAVLGALGAGLVVMSYAMDKLGSTEGVFKMATSFLALGAAITILAKALSEISDIAAAGNLGTSLASLAAIIAGVVVAMKLLNNVGKGVEIAGIKEILPAILSIVTVAVAVRVLVSAIEKLQDIKVKSIVESLATLVMIIGVVRLVISASSKIPLLSSVGLIGTVLALVAFINALDAIVSIDLGSLISAIPQLIIIVALFSKLMSVSKLAGKNAAIGGVGLLAMSGALILIAEALKIIVSLTDSDLAAATSSMTKIMVVIALIIAATNLAGKYSIRAGIAIVAMCAGLMMLSGAMAVLSKLDANGLDTATEALMKLQLMFVALVAVSKFATGTKATIIALVTSVTILSAAVATLAMIDPSSVRDATLCISAILGMFALVVAATGFAHEAAGTVVAIAAVLAELAFIFKFIAEIDAPSALNNCVGLSAIIASLSTLIIATAAIKTNVKPSFFAMQSMIILLGELAVVTKLLSMIKIDMNGEQLKAIAGITAIFTALTTALSIVGSWSKISPASAISAAISIAGVVAVLGGLMASIGTLSDALANLDISLVSKIESGMAVLNAVAKGIGEFIGNIVGGFTAGATSGLAEAAANIANFIKILGDVDPAGLDNFEKVIKSLGGVYKSQLLGNLAGIFGDSGLDTFGEDMRSLAEGIQAFAEGSKGINPDSVEPAIAAMDSISGLLKEIPSSGGLMSSIIGTKDLRTFGSTLKDFIGSLTEACETLQNSNFDELDISAVDKVVEVANKLAGITDAITPIGGLAAAFGGSTDLASFGSTLTLFISNMAEVSSAITNNDLQGLANTNAIDTIVKVTEKLSGLTAHIEPIGGLLAVLSGRSDLKSFGKTISGFVDGMVDLARAIDTDELDSLANVEKIDSIVETAKKLSELSTTITAVGGISDIFTGSTDLDDFAEHCVKFVKEMTKVYDVISDSKIDAAASVQMDMIIRGAKRLAELQEVIRPTQTVFSKLTTGDRSLNNFGSEVETFVRHMAKAFEALGNTNFDANSVSQIVDACNKLQELETVQNGATLDSSRLTTLADDIGKLTSTLATIDTSGFNKIAEGLKQFSITMNQFATIDLSGLDRVSQKLSELGTTAVDNLVNGLMSAKPRMSAAMTDLISSMTNGITTSTASVTSAIETLINGLVTTISSKCSDMQTAGTDLGLAISKGLDQGSKEINSTLDSVLHSAILTIERYRSSFEAAGSYAAAGMAAGIRAQKQSAIQAAIEMASAVTSAVKSALDINSPSKVMEAIGKFVDLGLVKGIADNTRVVTKQATTTAGAIITSFQKALKINSPSIVAKDDVGRYIIDGIAEGITEEMSAEEAAAQKAKNICDAFANEISKYDLRATTQSLEYQVWQAFNPNATKAETDAKSLEDARRRLGLQAEKALLYKGEYESVLAEFGAESDDTRNAYNDFLQAQIDLMSIATEIADMQTEIANSQIEAAEANREAFGEANKIYGQVYDNMAKFGYSKDEIWKYASDRAGYSESLGLLADSLTTTQNAVDIYNDAMNSALGLHSSYIEKISSQADYIYTTGQAISDAASKTVETIQALGNIQTSSAVEEPVSSIQQLYLALNNIAKNTDNESIIDAVSNALSLMPEDVEGAAQTTVDSFLNALNHLLDVCEKSDMLSPVITPVVDMSDAYAKFEQLQQMFGGGSTTTTTGTTASYANSNNKIASKSMSEQDKRRVYSGDGEKQMSTVNFTQNNYSPKSLDRSTIYRQTKTLIGSTSSKVNDKRTPVRKKLT